MTINKEEANSHLEHLFWKKDLEEMDLMKLENQTPKEVDDEMVRDEWCYTHNYVLPKGSKRNVDKKMLKD